VSSSRRAAGVRAPVVVRRVSVSGSRGICSCTPATVSHALCLGRIADVSPSPPCVSGSLSLSPSRSIHLCSKLQYTTLICSILFSRASRARGPDRGGGAVCEGGVCLFLLVLPKAEHGADDVLRRCHRERVPSRASGDGMERRVVRAPAGGGTISDAGTTL
jgi:hypothetical protein